MDNWYLFHGDGKRRKGVEQALLQIDPPPWRQFGKKDDLETDDRGIDLRWQTLQQLARHPDREKGLKKGRNFRISSAEETGKEVIRAVNAAIYLRRPLLVTGRPGSGKTSLAYAIAYELNSGPVLSWPITARSTLQEGLYRYDAIGRLQDVELQEKQAIGEYITLGALGTAFLPSLLPRVLLIDEIDKSDINLPNDLLNLFEEGEFPIPELVRRSQPENSEHSFTIWTQDEDKYTLAGGKVRCCAFPIIVMTSNGERDFPPAFKRRCLRVNMPDPQETALQRIVKAHFGAKMYQQKQDEIETAIAAFVPKTGESADRATDQLLNAIYLMTGKNSPQNEAEKQAIQEILWQRLNR